MQMVINHDKPLDLGVTCFQRVEDSTLWNVWNYIQLSRLRAMLRDLPLAMPNVENE